MFTYIYAGLTVPVIPLLTLGAAIGGAIPSHPGLEEAFATGSTGGAMMEMMRPAGDFRKFVAIILGFTVLGNMAGTMYSISCQFQLLLPFFAHVPRWIFAVLTTGIVTAVAIPVSRTLLLSLENFLGIISYWGAIFVGIFATEHYYFRGGNAATYDPAIWNDPKRLPLGAAAFTASALPFALIVPCMSQSWFQGPIARTTGDIGFEVALVLSATFYLVFRTFELKWTGR
jgi:purine-cytosine permease-like protein